MELSDVKTPKGLKAYWCEEINQAKKRFKNWQKKAGETLKIYQCEKSNTTPFNILHANTETLLPAIYSSTPTVDIRTRFNDKNERARKGAQILERALTYSFDEYDFHDSLTTCLKDCLVTGRGLIRIRYKPFIRRVAKEDESGEIQEQENVVWQSVSLDYVPWKQFYHSDAEIWNDVSWIAFEQYYTRDELKQLAGHEVLKKLSFASSRSDFEFKEDEKANKTCLYEVWDKKTRKVYFISEQLETPLAVLDDPLNLLDFFPLPRPLYSLRQTEHLLPIIPYSIYERQALELNETSRRILSLTRMLKFRGIRASEIPELDSLETLEDGEFIPSQSAMVFLQQGMGLDQSIWTMPLERIIQTLRELSAQREQIKQTIYEITGIADIMRGSTKSSETLGAQQLKAQWGSLRIQQIQQEFQRFIRDLIRLKSEIIASKFSTETLSYLAGEMIPPDVTELLRGDLQRNYTIDIETDSTIRGDMARNQQNMTQFLGATASYLQTISPAIQQGILPPDLALTIFSSFARQFKLGKNVEDKLAEHVEKAEQDFKASEARKQQEEQKEAQEAEEAKALSKQKMMIELEKEKAGIEKSRMETEKERAEAEGQALENSTIAGGFQP